MGNTKFDTPTMWNVVDLLRYVDVDLEWSKEQVHAFQEWIEYHYLDSESPEATVGRFKRTKIGKQIL